MKSDYVKILKFYDLKQENWSYVNNYIIPEWNCSVIVLLGWVENYSTTRSNTTAKKNGTKV
jgi:hypothetical protein